MEISIIIPVYNEEKIIEKSLDSIISFMEKSFKRYEIIVVDDGSTDLTKTLLSRFSDKITILKNTLNMGKGYSVKKGIMYASGKKIIFTDADMAYPAEYIKIFYDKLDSHDIIIGKRDGQKNAYPIYRRIMSNTLATINRFLLGDIPRDTQCGIKGFKNDTAKAIFEKCTINGFGFDIELLSIANILKKSISEHPVTMQSFEKSKVCPLYHSYKMILDIVKIKLNLLTGHYTKNHPRGFGVIYAYKKKKPHIYKR